jgi:hypothetical protein
MIHLKREQTLICWHKAYRSDYTYLWEIIPQIFPSFYPAFFLPWWKSRKKSVISRSRRYCSLQLDEIHTVWLDHLMTRKYRDMLRLSKSTITSLSNKPLTCLIYFLTGLDLSPYSKISIFNFGDIEMKIYSANLIESGQTAWMCRIAWLYTGHFQF